MAHKILGMDSKPNTICVHVDDTVEEGSVIDFRQNFLHLLPEYMNMWHSEDTKSYELNSFNIHNYKYKKGNVLLNSWGGDLS